MVGNRISTRQIYGNMVTSKNGENDSRMEKKKKEMSIRRSKESTKGWLTNLLHKILDYMVENVFGLSISMSFPVGCSVTQLLLSIPSYFWRKELVTSPGMGQFSLRQRVFLLRLPLVQITFSTIAMWSVLHYGTSIDMFELDMSCSRRNGFNDVTVLVEMPTHNLELQITTFYDRSSIGTIAARG